MQPSRVFDPGRAAHFLWLTIFEYGILYVNWKMILQERRRKNWWQMKRKFRDFKIGQKLFICNVGIILIMAILIGGCGYYIFRNILVERSQEQSEDLMEQLSRNYAYALNTVEELLNLQTYNREFSSLLRGDTEDMTYNEKYDRRKQIESYGYNLINFNKYITNVLVADNFDNIYYISGREKKMDTQLLESYLDKEMAYDMWGVPFWKACDEDQVLVTKLIFDYVNMKPLGVAAVGVDSEYFREIYGKLPDKNGNGIVILDKEQRVMLASDKGSENLSGIILSEYPEDSLGGGEIYYQNQKYIYTTRLESKGRIQVMNLISEEAITSVIYDKLMLPLYLLVGISVLFSACLALLISGQISSNIKLLLDNIRRLARGDFSEKIVPNGCDEIGMLAVEFNDMSSKIQQLIRTVANEKIQKKNSELKAIQFEYDALAAKINPHFLYNTLESINSLAKINGQEKISDSLYLLGNYLREAISNKHKFVTLEEEMENIRQYLEIQKLSYGEKIQVEFDCEEMVSEAMVPKLILQPLVENAIIHGLEMKIGQGHIRITSRCERTDVIVTVEDDGVGINSERLQAIMKGEVQAAPGHSKVGLQAVHKRLQILYGEPYGIKIESEENRGTRIFVRMPIRFEGEEER